jgi:hypothetical protein
MESLATRPDGTPLSSIILSSNRPASLPGSANELLDMTRGAHGAGGP